MRFIACLLVFSLLAVTADCARETPEQALAAYIRYWQAGDYEGMYGLLSVRARKNCSQEVFLTRHRKISQGIGLKKLSLKISGFTEGVMAYSLAFDTATAGEFSFNYNLGLVAEEGSWRLNWNHGHIFPGLSPARVVRVRRDMPQRGRILSADGKALAAPGAAYQVGIIPGSLGRDTISLLSALLDIPAQQIEDSVAVEGVTPESFVPVAMVDSESWALLRQPVTALPGVLVRAKSGRMYNIPFSLAQTVGYIGEIQAGQLTELAPLGFELGDPAGRCGLELLYNRALAGKPGFVIEIRDENDDILTTVARRPAEPGADLVCTLELDKCKILDTALGNWSGCALLLDFCTGEILGVASKPGFDCNLFARGISASQYQELLAQDSPFLHRAFNGLYPPGSVFKPLTALMALAEKVFDPAASWDTPLQWQGEPAWGGYRVTRVLRPPGPVDLREAMRWSDNVYFADLGLKVGWPAFTEYTRRLGFGQDLPLPLSYEQSRVGGEKGTVLLADSSYGQGRVLTTPLHMALMYAAIARGDGVLPQPLLLQGSAPGAWLQTGFAPENIALLDSVLVYAASDSSAPARVSGGAVRGKTGTAEINRTRQVAWYICYFDNLLLAVTLEGDSALSSTHAVQVARECLSKIRLGQGN